MSASPSEGERIALRRKRLGWKQQVLADKAGVGITTVVQIEKDRNVHSDRLKAVMAALDKAEKRSPAVTSPDHPVRHDEPSMKEGADADTRIKIADARLERIELFLAETLEDVRRARADLSRQPSDESRKRG